MAPTTGFEDSSGASWTTLAQEAAFLATIANETDATLSQAGESLDGEPIWRIDIGNPSGPTWMVVGGVHGDEPAAREAALQHVRDLAYSAVQADVDYLAAHRIAYVPNCNPDSTEVFSHTNANGFDVNRDHWELSQPESRAVQAVFSDAAPQMLADLHERDAVQLGTQMLWRRPELAVLYSGIGTVGDDLITDLETAFDNATISNDLYPTPGRQSLREAAALRHALGMLIETDVVNDTPTDRVDFQLLALETMRTFHANEQAALTAMQTDSRTYQATTTDTYHLQSGNAGTVPWPGEDLPDDLAGYRLLGGLTPLAFDVYGVNVINGNVVPLSQQQRAIIPILLDPDSEDVEATAVRLTVVTSPAVVATVQEFAEVVYGSHRMVAEAYVLSTFQTGNNPAGTQVDIIDGDVHMDATAEIFASLELTTNGMDERRRSRFPRRAGDLLAPYGTEVFVRRGVDIGSEIMWSPLGYFRLEDAEQLRASDQPIRLSGQDRMSRIIKGRLMVPRQFRRTATFAEVAANLVTDIYPAAVITFDDDSGEATIGRTMLVEEDRYAGLLDLAESLGKVVYFDGEGVLRFEDPPPADDLVWHLKAGYHGVLADNDRYVSDDGMANAIVVRGEGGDTVAPVLAIVVDDGPNSPTRFFPPDDPTELWFGQVPDFYSSPLVTTQGQGVSAGTSLLRRRIGMPYHIGWTSVVNPALRPRHAIRVTQKDGNRERHLVETLSIPLAHGRGMTGTTMEQTNVRISEVKPSSLAGSI